MGGLRTFGSLPLLFLPLSGGVANQVDRRRLLIVAQLLGAGSTILQALLVMTNEVALWHIYAWTLVRGVIWLLARPGYRVILTESVPTEEVRSATSVNSMSESVSRVVVDSVGGLLLTVVGLPIAFILNAATYLSCVGCARGLCDMGQLPDDTRTRVAARRVLADLVNGVVYLAR